MSLPKLREELALYPGPRLADGQPSWTLHDPVRNQFFRLDWLTFELLSRWSLQDAAAILAAISTETTLQPEVADVEAVLQFLAENQLLQAGAKEGAFAARFKAQRSSWGKWLLHHYLFFRVPLIKPDRWLTRFSARVAPLYSRGFFQLSLLAWIVGVVMVYRDWDRFSATLVDLFTWKGLIAYGVALFGVKVLHELGHAFTAKRYGCRVPAMGVAFLVLWPVAYTDTNEAWKLADRRQRLAIAGSGIITELIVAVWATLAWAMLPEGTPKSIAFILATTTWIATLAVNSSPFMRFDGYFLLSDWLDLPNLHSRAFALARWDLRERLFKLGDAPPEYFPPRRTRNLILFAYATWIYRLTLFLGIAVLVYHFAVKAIGILLFIVEIGWFVLLPIWGEIKIWRERWPVLRESARAKRSAMIALALAALVIVPWPTRVASSALLRPTEIFPIYAPEGAQVIKLNWREGAAVPAGQALIELASPDLVLRWQRATAQVQQLQWQVAAAGLNAGLRPDAPVLQQELITAQAELHSIETTLEQYTPRAPFAGELRDLDPDLKPGVWVGRGERLAVLVQNDQWRVETYLDEDALRRIRVGDRARFYSDGGEGTYLPLTVTAIDRDATRVLTSGVLAAPFGGSVVVREKQGQLIPERALYHVVLSAPSPGNLRGHSWRGTVVLHGRWEAPGVRLLRYLLSIVWREAGF